MSTRNKVAKDLRTPKYKPRIVEDKRRKKLDKVKEREARDEDE